MEKYTQEMLVDADSYSGIKGIIYGVLSLLNDSEFNQKAVVTDELIKVVIELTELEACCLHAISKEKLPHK